MIHMNRGHRIDTIFVLLIFCVFAISVLMVLMLGANTYENVTKMTRDGREDLSVLSYIWTKVKNYDDAGCIYIGDFNGISALYIEEVYGETIYYTAVYQYDDWLYELFCEFGVDLFPEDGSPIIRLDDLTFTEYKGGLIEVSSGNRNLLIFPRGDMQGADSPTVIAEGGVSG
jgi:hypothetical protein